MHITAATAPVVPIPYQVLRVVAVSLAVVERAAMEVVHRLPATLYFKLLAFIAFKLRLLPLQSVKPNKIPGL